MARKIIFQGFVVVLVLLGSFVSASSAQAGSGCGGTYTVQWGDSLGFIAEHCGTTISALYAANPGLSYWIYPGQVLVIPRGDYCNCPYDGGYYGTYIVQRGDTFYKIAARLGISMNALWAANPQIWDINRIYAGQVIYVPSTITIVHVTPEPLVPRTYGPVPPQIPFGKVQLINSAKAQVYVSLQCTTPDGVTSILEYPVEGKMKVNAPIGQYIYVAWVGGRKFDGNFSLNNKTGDLSITFYKDKVVVHSQ